MDIAWVQWLTGIGISLGVSGVLAFVARAYPKSKAIEIGTKLGSITGLAITKFGNSKIGKKLWSKVEEGPIITALAFCMAFFTNVGKSMLSDNYVILNKEKKVEDTEKK